MQMNCSPFATGGIFPNSWSPKAMGAVVKLVCLVFSLTRLTHHGISELVQEWSCGRGILSACEKIPRKQDKSLVTSVSTKA